MSITVTGPEGYHYQHDATAWLVLAWRNEASLDVKVETGLEDATFGLTVDANSRVLEAQFKSEKGPIGEDRFATWLAHFPPRRGTHTLLEALRDDPSLSVLFVVADATTDVVADLCIREPGEALRPRPDATLTRANADRLLGAFGKAYEHPKTALQYQRNKHCTDLATKFGKDNLRDVAKRIFVLPQHNRSLIRSKARIVLNKEFIVPFGQTDDVLKSLAELVEAGAKNKQDIAKRVLDESEQRGVSLLLRPRKPHVKRMEEDALFDVLMKRNALLLTGLPNAGKTQLARSLATRLQRDGYHAHEGSDFDDARRFLRAAGSEQRVFLLEDPFGQVFPMPAAPQTLSMLRHLLDDVEPHRKLIVTSRSDIWQFVYGDANRPIDGHRVHDVSLTDENIAVSVWEKHAELTGIDPDMRIRVQKFLNQQRPDDLLQPGQIRHLAAELRGRVDVMEDQWLRIARYDGEDIGKYLAGRSTAMWDVLAALRILASTNIAVDNVELAFVLAEGAQELPSRSESLLSDGGRSIGLGFATESPIFPHYSQRYGVARAHEDALGELERRGLIERVSNGYRFSHPSFLLAAEQTIHGITAIAFQRILATCTKALYCLNPRNAIHALDTIGLLHAIPQLEPHREKLVNLVYECYLGSVFPALQDKCLLWLLRRRSALNEEQQERILRDLRDWERGESHIVFDGDGRAWLDTRNHVSTFDPSRAIDFFPRTSEDTRAVDALRKAKDSETLPLQTIWKLVYRRRAGTTVEPNAIERAFSYDESFLRARAAYVAMRDSPQRSDWVERTFLDEHPRVFAAGIDGLLFNWDEPDQAVRAAVLRRALDLKKDMSAEWAATILQLFTVEDDGSDPPAEAWALLVNAALRVASPLELHIGDHLYHYSRKFLCHINRDLAFEILEAWLGWIERAVRTSHRSDDSIRVCRFWLMVTGSNSTLRAGIIERLLQQPDTTFFLGIVAHLVNGWEQLDDAERERLLTTLEGPRVDARWARAVALTRDRPPPALVARILGAEDALSKILKRRLEPAWPHLLEDCLRIIDDVGGVIGLGVADNWYGILLRITLEPSHPQFEMAVRFLIQARWDRRKRVAFWERRMWPFICASADDDTRERLFDVLLAMSVRINGGKFEKLWTALLDDGRFSDEVAERWARRILDNIEAIESYGNVRSIMSNKKLNRIVFDLLWSDMSMIHVLNKMPNQPNILTQAFREFVGILYTKNAPRLLRVHNKVLSALGAERLNDNADDLVELVRKARSATLENASRQRTEMRKRLERPIDDFVILADESD